MRVFALAISWTLACGSLACGDDNEGPASGDPDGGMTGDPLDSGAGEGDPDSGTPDGGMTEARCRLSEPAKLLMEDVLRTHIFEAMFMARASNVENELSYALRLPGSGFGIIGTFFLTEGCTEPIPGEHRCTMASQPPGSPPRSPFHVDHDTCNRRRCEAAGISLSDAYATMRPHEQPDDRHEFTYDLEQREGMTGRMARNPTRTWREDARDRAAALVSTEIDDDLVVTVADPAEVVDLARSGTISIPMIDFDFQKIDLVFSFPILGPSDLSASGVEIVITSESQLSGAILSEGRTIANLSADLAADLDAPFVDWQGVCEDK